MRNTLRLGFVFCLLVLLSAGSILLLDQPATAQNGTIPPKTYHTLPANFPPMTVTVKTAGVGDGYLFLANFGLRGCAIGFYSVIVDNAGEPVFYDRGQTCYYATDLKVQNGLLTYFDTSNSAYFVLDNTYTVVDTWQTIGYETDAHELLLLPNGHALMMAYDYQVVDNTSQIVPNGRPTATVIGLIIQELDAAKNLAFEWKSWDHIPISDTYDLYLTEEPVDYVHGNAIEVDTDSNLLISSRHLNEITKIDRRSGAIIWRLGGKRNQFTFIGDPKEFSHQHDIRRLANGNITLYDNGNFLAPAYSRAIEYRLDEVNRTATLISEYRNTPDTYAPFTGNHQRLGNGNILVGWGASSNPAVTEFYPNGSKAFELALPPGHLSYRIFRFPWEGHPTWPPTLMLDGTTLYYSWNGATEVVGYRVYGGVTVDTGEVIATSVKKGFETSTILTDDIKARFCYYWIVPVNREFEEETASEEIFLDSPACHVTPTLTPTLSPVPTHTPTPMETTVNDEVTTPTPMPTPTPIPTETPIVITLSPTPSPTEAMTEPATTEAPTVEPTIAEPATATPTPTTNKVYLPVVGG